MSPSFPSRRSSDRWLEKRFDLLLVDAVTERPLHDLGSGIEPRFSPDGEKLAFYSNRTGEMQLWVWDMKTHQARQLTSLQGGVDADPKMRISGYLIDAFRFDWSPNGRQIVFITRIGLVVPQNGRESSRERVCQTG